MNQDYQNQNPDTSVNSDEDDEFGGGKITVDKLYSNRKRKITPIQVPVISSYDNEDDEFGGGRITVATLLKKPINENVVDTDSHSLNSSVVQTEIKTHFNCEYKIFSSFIPTNEWYVDREELYDTVQEFDCVQRSITIPLVIDTEFDQNKGGRKEYQQKPRLGLSTQICGIGEGTPRMIFAHNERVNMGRSMANDELLPLIKSDFHPIDYLNSIGLNVKVREGTESELIDLPKCYFVLYGHFLTAEINMICDGSVKKRIKQLQQSQGNR